MRKTLLPLACVALLASCQKELSFDSTNPAAPATTGGTSGGGAGGSTGSGLLIKAVAVTGSETVTTNYTYDAQKRLYIHTDAGTSGGMAINLYRRLERDAAGRIIRVVQKSGDITGMPSDTAYHTVHYPNATAMDPDYSVNRVSMSMAGMSMITTDSSVYNYTGGKLMSWNTYMTSEMAGMSIPGGMNGKWELTYDASNRVSTQKNYNDGGNPGSPMTLFASQKFTYGTQAQYIYTSASPMQNFLMHGAANGGAYAVTKFESTSPGTPAVDVVVATTYTTGTGGKVTSATATQSVTGQPTLTTRYTFTYQ